MQDSYIERCNKTYRHEILDMHLFRTLDYDREKTDNWIIGYNDERPHDLLGDRTPWKYLANN